MKKIHLKRLIYCTVAAAFLISCKSKQIAYQPTTPSEIAAETAIVDIPIPEKGVYVLQVGTNNRRIIFK